MEAAQRTGFRIGRSGAAFAAVALCGAGPLALGAAVPAVPIVGAELALLCAALQLAKRARLPIDAITCARDALAAAGAIGFVACAGLATNHITLADVIALAPLVLVAPLCEEIVYRGVLYRSIRCATPVRAPLAAILLCSATFAVAHGAPFSARHFGFSLACGLAFQLLAAPDGRLLASMLAHAGVNTTVLQALER